MASGLEYYAAYPMTPASSLIDVIAPDPRVTFFQGEDEIAVSMSMLGAKFAGKRAACGTSGGGFALMTESISFSHVAELGGLYILSQRDGPSTGTPTFTGQGDLNYALNASFGDTFPIVLAPSTFEESYNLIGKALNRSDIYQHPVIYLIDKQLSEGYLSVDAKDLHAENINRGKLQDMNALD
jgi:2-oxoglutarate ferredoxin oxidoreductase subunit alpha